MGLTLPQSAREEEGRNIVVPVGIERRRGSAGRAKRVVALASVFATAFNSACSSCDDNGGGGDKGADAGMDAGAPDAAVVIPLPPDVDRDGVPNDSDNCRFAHNPEQGDSERNDDGTLGDGIGDRCDNCRFVVNPDQADTDDDGDGDACDKADLIPNFGQPDIDGDGIVDVFDLCKTEPLPVIERVSSTNPPTEPPYNHVDADSDGYGRECDCLDDVTGGASVHPGLRDPVCDGVDQNCNSLLRHPTSEQPVTVRITNVVTGNIEELEVSLEESCECVLPSSAAETVIFRPPEANVGRCQLTLTCRRTADDDGRLGSEWFQSEVVSPIVEVPNGIDDDCDGATDEGLRCTNPGGTSPCGFTTGRCANRRGEMVCLPDGSFGPCVGAIEPEIEICDQAKLDEDCDGSGNEGCQCENGMSQSCGDSEGECRSGTQLCQNGVWKSCEGEVGPADFEFCDGLDNDCDGLTDEDFGTDRLCLSAGVCGEDAEGNNVSGQVECAGPFSIRCNTDSTGTFGRGLATQETCDGRDNDCDGLVDEPFFVGQACVLLPPCGAGVQICDSANPLTTVCSSSLIRVDENFRASCNRRDDDCDGVTDPGCDCGAVLTNGQSRSCGTDEGICHTGLQTCEDGILSDCIGDEDGDVEVCNHIDDDCDGDTDEAGCECYRNDTRDCGSAIGECRRGIQRCDGTTGQWLPDCEDDVARGVEGGRVNCNGLDDDCDGSTDETCFCVDGSTQACGSAVGECNAGTQTCEDGQWLACEDETGPATDLCEGLDRDCDGEIDEGCACSENDERNCGTDMGECVQGIQICSDRGVWGACGGAVVAVPEGGVTRCDTFDNDCDGAVDEGCICANDSTRPCGTDVGECSFGSQTCVGGRWGVCGGSVGPVAELCDGIDNDCDSATDESCLCVKDQIRDCGSSTGECEQGAQTCNDRGIWSPCAGGVTRVTEGATILCNALDDDCDGSTDEGCICTAGATRNCGTDVGICEFGTQTCGADGRWGTCAPGVLPGARELCDAALADEDCDNLVNENCACVEGGTQACGSAVGTCRQGVRTCDINGMLSAACAGEALPVPEGGIVRCNGLDDDCDGATDEGCECVDGSLGACGTGVGVCVPGERLCTAGRWGICVGEVGPGTETCDVTRRDENCNGSSNEGCPCDEGEFQPCGLSEGECSPGTQTCDSRGLLGLCVGAVGVVAEGDTIRCDGLDNDCDGATDEGCQCHDGFRESCGTNEGECVAGERVCAAGRWGTCVGEVRPGSETCDDRDNDCDASTDEGCP